MKHFSLLLILISLSIAINAQSLTDSLIAYYPFNGNTNDSSGNNNKGIANGAQLTADRFNRPNTAYHFNGTTDFIEIANSNSLDLGTNFSFSFWFHQDSSINKGYRILDKNTAGIPDGYGVDTYGASGGKVVRLYFGAQTANMTTVHTLKIWNHVVITYDGTNVKFYLNGQLENTSTIPMNNPPTNNFPLLIGCGQNGSTKLNFFKGDLDEIRIYRRSLASSEVQTLFTEKPLSISDVTSNLFLQNLVYPNPTTGDVFLLSEDYAIEKITDILGREVIMVSNNPQPVCITDAGALYFVYIKNVRTNTLQIVKVYKTDK